MKRDGIGLKLEDESDVVGFLEGGRRGDVSGDV